MAEPRILSGQNQLTPAMTDEIYLYRPSTNDSAKATVQAVRSGAVSALDAAATLTAEDAGLVTVANTEAIAVTLPSATSMSGLGFSFVKTSADAFAITLTPAGAETINGAASHATMDAQYDTVTIVSDGSNWLITAQQIA